MSLKKILFLNYNSEYAYAPPQVEALINTDHITTCVPVEARGSGPFVRITFTNRDSLVAVGKPEDFLS
jgi:hypothetical protein